MHYYTFQSRAPPVRTANRYRRCRAAVGPTSHGVREGRGRAALHRIAVSTFCGHRVAAAESASRGQKRPFGLSPANEWLPMPTATSPMGNVRSRTVWTYRSASGRGRCGSGVAPLSPTRVAKPRARAVSGGALDHFERMRTSRS